MQQVAKILKKAYSDKCKRLEKEMLDLNTLTKEIKIFERFKLGQQDAI